MVLAVQLDGLFPEEATYALLMRKGVGEEREGGQGLRMQSAGCGAVLRGERFAPLDDVTSHELETPNRFVGEIWA